MTSYHDILLTKIPGACAVWNVVALEAILWCLCLLSVWSIVMVSSWICMNLVWVGRDVHSSKLLRVVCIVESVIISWQASAGARLLVADVSTCVLFVCKNWIFVRLLNVGFCINFVLLMFVILLMYRIHALSVIWAIIFGPDKSFAAQHFLWVSPPTDNFGIADLISYMCSAERAGERRDDAFVVLPGVLNALGVPLDCEDKL